MENKKYAQIQYDPEDLHNAAVKEVTDQGAEESLLVNELAEQVKEMAQSVEIHSEKEEKKAPDVMDVFAGEAVAVEEFPAEMETELEKETEAEKKTAPEKEMELEKERVSGEKEPTQESVLYEESDIKNIKEDIACIYGVMRRLEKKFEAEILDSQNKAEAVKSIYKELNEYKAGLVEKALKNVLYDIIDMREMMFSKVKFVREKEGKDMIPLEEFESYADDIGDILEKHEVTIYKGETGVENTAVRQKIVRKVETADASMVKKVAESLSYGYEYNGKIIYPEKISIYVKSKE